MVLTYHLLRIERHSEVRSGAGWNWDCPLFHVGSHWQHVTHLQIFNFFAATHKLTLTGGERIAKDKHIKGSETSLAICRLMRHSHQNIVDSKLTNWSNMYRWLITCKLWLHVQSATKNALTLRPKSDHLSQYWCYKAVQKPTDFINNDAHTM